jgi:hypothetical protein
MATTDQTRRELQERLTEFSFDDPLVERPFSVQLAEENGWTPEFTLRAIEEYRRFLYLAVICDHPVVPSQVVDKVWHLHLLHARCYWNNLCRDLLGRPIYHTPSVGGSAAQGELRTHYLSTLASYRRAFGTPPGEIWPAPVEEEREEQGEQRWWEQSCYNCMRG